MTSPVEAGKNRQLARLKLGVCIALAFAAGGAIGTLVFGGVPFVTYSQNGCLSDLKFVNPQPGCEIFERKLAEIDSLKAKLNSEIDAYLASKRADRISVFARDLVSNRFVGVNINDQFDMASLVKVPLAIAYFRLSELTPDVLDQKITYDGTPDLYADQTIPPSQKLGVGETYTMKDLIERALVYSDNTAAQILSDNFVSYDYLQKILVALGLQPKDPNATEYTTTVQTFSGVFRSLYNSSLLTRKSSNEILKILSGTDFADGATKDLPAGVRVAHKFGERAAQDPGSPGSFTRQLHDCGIVYAKDGKEPYTFCIMTEGDNLTDLEAVIQNLSSTIYAGLVQ